MAEDKHPSKNLMSKTVVSKSGKKFGIVGDLTFETRTGELIYLLLKQPTQAASNLDLEKSRDGNLMIPFSSVIAVGDFIVISEEDII